jgi:hypothetical protein
MGIYSNSLLTADYDRSGKCGSAALAALLTKTAWYSLPKHFLITILETSSTTFAIPYTIRTLKSKEKME